MNRTTILDFEEVIHIPQQIKKKFTIKSSLADLLALKERVGICGLRFYTDENGTLGSTTLNINSMILFEKSINFILKEENGIYFFNLKFKNQKDTEGTFSIRKIER